MQFDVMFTEFSYASAWVRLVEADALFRDSFSGLGSERASGSLQTLEPGQAGIGISNQIAYIDRPGKWQPLAEIRVTVFLPGALNL